MVRGASCCHSLLLTEKWRKQAGLVREMMERMEQSPPQELLAMADDLEEVCVCVCVCVRARTHG